MGFIKSWVAESLQEVGHGLVDQVLITVVASLLFGLIWLLLTLWCQMLHICNMQCDAENAEQISISAVLQPHFKFWSSADHYY